MSILVVDVGGANQTTLSCQRGGHAPNRMVGTKPIGFAGEQTSSIRAELMVVPVVLTELTPTQIGVLRTLFKNGAQVDCSGDVFNNSSATVTCSGILSDDFEPAGPWFIGSLTLYEIGTDLGYGASGTTPFVLTTGNVASPSGSPFGACFRVLDSATPATCGDPLSPDTSMTCPITYSAASEMTWTTSAATGPGTIAGDPYVTFVSKGINGFSGIALQSTKAILYQVRASVDIASWQTNYAAGDWAGGTIRMDFPTGLLVSINTGDSFRLELWGRLALYGGGSDSQPYVLARQTICYPGYLYLPGNITPLFA